MLRISLCVLLALFLTPEAGAQTGAPKPFAFDNSLLAPLLPDGYYFYSTQYEFGVISGIVPPQLVQTPILYRTIIRSDNGSIIPVERIME